LQKPLDRIRKKQKGEMAVHFDRKTLRNIFLGVGACIVLYWVLHETERFKSVYDTLLGIFAPFIIGAGLAFIINVPMRSIENKFVRVKNANWRRTLAVLATFLVILLVLTLVFYLLIPQVVETAETVALKLPDFFNNLWIQFMAFLEERPELLAWVTENTSLESFNIGGILENWHKGGVKVLADIEKTDNAAKETASKKDGNSGSNGGAYNKSLIEELLNR
jgi:hypothetical protein